MKVAFRADASLQMGSGHVMRCLTLADALKGRGVECHFISRELRGHMLELIRQLGFSLSVLPAESNDYQTISTQDPAEPTHAGWLGCSWKTDTEQCRAILEHIHPDCLIVDHYALDQRWETALQPYYRKLMVIDDLADRPHFCDLLLDQTYGRTPDDYLSWVSADCSLLCGSQYALLRPEFAALRPYSLLRRENPQLEHLLITMGGVDKGNATCQVLKALRHCALPKNCHITVVMGAQAPWIVEVRRHAEQMPWFTEVRVNISNMAQLMADSDLAIGAAGSTSWERCCLGLPTVMVVLADNQKTAAILLEEAQVAWMLSLGVKLPFQLRQIIERINNEKKLLLDISEHAKLITDGTGCQFVVNKLMKLTTDSGQGE